MVFIFYNLLQNVLYFKWFLAILHLSHDDMICQHIISQNVFKKHKCIYLKAFDVIDPCSIGDIETGR